MSIVLDLSMKKSLIVSIWLLALLGFANLGFAADNPFTKAVAENPFARAPLLRFAKPFSSADVVLDLELAGDVLQGTLQYRSLAQSFEARGSVVDGVLTGFFAHEGQEFAFRFELDESGAAGALETGGQRFRLEAGFAAAVKSERAGVAVVETAKDVMEPRVRELFEEAAKIARRADEYSRDSAISWVSAELGRAGDWDTALEMAEEARGEYTKDVPYFSFVTVTAEQGDVEGTLRHCDRMRTNVFRESVQFWVGKSYLNAGDSDGAVAYVESLLSADDRAKLYAQLSSNVLANGDVAFGKRLLEKAEKEAGNRLPPGFSISVILAYLELGDFEAALTWLNKEPEPLVQMIALASVAETFVEAGRQKDAMRMEDWAKKLTKRADGLQRAVFAGYLAKVRYLAGLKEKAFETYDAIPDLNDLRDNQLLGLYLLLLDKGRFEDAREIEGRIKSRAIQERARLSLIQHKARRKGADLDALLSEARRYSANAEEQSKTFAVIAAMIARPELASGTES